MLVFRKSIHILVVGQASLGYSALNAWIEQYSKFHNIDADRACFELIELITTSSVIWCAWWVYVLKCVVCLVRMCNTCFGVAPVWFFKRYCYWYTFFQHVYIFLPPWHLKTSLIFTMLFIFVWIWSIFLFNLDIHSVLIYIRRTNGFIFCALPFSVKCKQ